MLPVPADPFRARATLTLEDQTTLAYYRLDALASLVPARARQAAVHGQDPARERAAQPDARGVHREPRAAAGRPGAPAGPRTRSSRSCPRACCCRTTPACPCVVDLAAMRAAMARLGGDPKRINPLVPADLVIDHSVQVDAFGSRQAFEANVEREYERNVERYTLLRWAQHAFQNFRVVPPGTGIVHQVNLEYLARPVQTRAIGERERRLPRHGRRDRLAHDDDQRARRARLGRRRHRGRGGPARPADLHADARRWSASRCTAQLPEGTTATDLVLTVTQMLRKHGVVGKFVEFYGPGLEPALAADRATIANMAPEYGATTGLFPIDDETLNYLRLTGRPAGQVELAERYSKEQGLFRTDETPDPVFSETLELDLVDGRAEPGRPEAAAGPRAARRGAREPARRLPGLLPGPRGGRGEGAHGRRGRRDRRVAPPEHAAGRAAAERAAGRGRDRRRAHRASSTARS